MKKITVFHLLLSFLLVGCSTKIDISSNARFKNLIGHSLNTRVPLKLYEIDYQLSGSKNRYELGGNVLGRPLVGILPKGNSVLFERAVCRNGWSASTEHLEGAIKFRGETYPITYFLGLRGQDSYSFWKGLDYDFVIPERQIGESQEKAKGKGVRRHES